MNFLLQKRGRQLARDGPRKSPGWGWGAASPQPARAAAAGRWGCAARPVGGLSGFSPEQGRKAGAGAQEKRAAATDGPRACRLRRTLSRLEELRREKELCVQRTR